MARLSRPIEEVEATKQRIIDSALDIIRRNGYESLTMKALAKRLGMAAPGIYYYYKSKEEIYLVARRQGLLLLYEQAEKFSAEHDDPFCKLKAYTKGFINFALRYPHYYHILFTQEVKKYASFVGTPLQDTAAKTSEVAEPAVNLSISNMEDLAKAYHLFPKKEARVQYMLWLSGIHGIVALYQNNVLNTIHDSPADTISFMADRFLSLFRPPAFKASSCKCHKRKLKG